jgi:hypothetical protein
MIGQPTIETRAEGDCAMSRMTRRVLIRTTSAAAGVAAFGILTRRSDAAEFTWRYANEMVPTHSMNVHLQQAAELIRRDSGGRMDHRMAPGRPAIGPCDRVGAQRPDCREAQGRVAGPGRVRPLMLPQ